MDRGLNESTAGESADFREDCAQFHRLCCDTVSRLADLSIEDQTMIIAVTHIAGALVSDATRTCIALPVATSGSELRNTPPRSRLPDREALLGCATLATAHFGLWLPYYVAVVRLALWLYCNLSVTQSEVQAALNAAVDAYDFAVEPKYAEETSGLGSA